VNHRVVDVSMMIYLNCKQSITFHQKTFNCDETNNPTGVEPQHIVAQTRVKAVDLIL
jgi:hypothetical protein